MVESLFWRSSLFDDVEGGRIKELCLETCFSQPNKASELRRLFFRSPKIMHFVTGRLLLWSNLCQAAHDFVRASQNVERSRATQNGNGSAPPVGAMDAWGAADYEGSTAALPTVRDRLLDPADPRGLLQQLNLIGNMAPLSDVLHRVEAIQRRQVQAGSGPKGAAAAEPPHSVAPTLYADPCNLSPISSLPYLFISAPRSSTAGQNSAYYQSNSTYGTSSTAPTDATCRWERLMLLLSAKLAWKKIKLLLYWLQTQLMFTHGMPECMNWLTNNVVEHAKNEYDTGATAAFLI